MHSIVLLTAMTATTGLFGGHRQARTASCSSGSCARPAAVAYAPTSSCQTGQCGQPSGYAYAQPAYAPTAYAQPTYAPTSYAPPAYAYAQAARPMTYNSYYYPPTQASCATGNCPRR